MTGPTLWYLNRGTGVVLMLVLTAVLALGVLSMRRAAPGRWSGTAYQLLHRRLGSLALALLGVHVASAILDEYVDISWWEAFMPFRGSYRPFALGLGIVAVDLFVVASLAALLRRRLPQRWWRGAHLATYAAWVSGVWHGLAIGTDTAQPWLRETAVVAITVAAGAAFVRLVLAASDRSAPRRPAATAAVTR